MTELSFLLELLLEHELKKETQTLIRNRIKEIETLAVNKPIVVPAGAVIAPPQVQQAPSTLANLAREAAEAPAIQIPPPPPASRRIVGGEVVTGQGTRGPRKF